MRHRVMVRNAEIACIYAIHEKVHQAGVRREFQVLRILGIAKTDGIENHLWVQRKTTVTEQAFDID